jgi:hypothetical protein
MSKIAMRRGNLLAEPLRPHQSIDAPERDKAKRAAETDLFNLHQIEPPNAATQRHFGAAGAIGRSPANR